AWSSMTSTPTPIFAPPSLKPSASIPSNAWWISLPVRFAVPSHARLRQLMTMDAHHHLWKYSAAEYGWISPEMSVIRRDFLPADLEPLMHHFGIEGTIAVQARQTLEETSWLLDLAQKHPVIRGVVGWVPLVEGDNVKRHLER